MLELLQKTKLDKKQKRSNRLNFPPYYGGVFGISRARFTGKIGLSRLTKLNPKLWEALQQVHVPLPWNSIQINKNLVCPKHKDSTNVGNSYIISYGNYTGGELVIEGVPHDTRTGLIFNGFEKEHWNNPIEGEKYSVIFFVSKYYEGVYPNLP
jgi:hypothetical protein